MNWYRKYIGRYLFRKLLLSISAVLFIAFILLGILSHRMFYSLLEDREQALLQVRTTKFADKIHGLYTSFQEAVSAMYTDDTIFNNELIRKYKFLSEIPAPDDRNHIYLQKSYFVSMLNYIKKNLPEASSLILYRVEDHIQFSNYSYTVHKLQSMESRRHFFDGFHKGNRFPFLGRLEDTATKAAIPYIISPIFDIEHPSNPIVAYLLVLFDTELLLKQYNDGFDEASSITILNNEDELWLDGQGQHPLPEARNKQYFIHEMELGNEQLRIVAYKSKQIVQSHLSSLQLLIYVFLGATLLICIPLIGSLNKHIIRRLNELISHFKQLRQSSFPEPIEVDSQDEISHVIRHFNQLSEQLQQHIREVYISELQRRQAEYYALKVQINPHFLYNTLESIRMMAIMNQQHMIGDKLTHMGQLLRWVLKTDQDIISIEEELRYLQYYIELATLSYAELIELEIDSSIPLRKYTILKFILQPIIENAIKHGQLDILEQARIRISFQHDDAALHITVWNNGKGLDRLASDHLNELIHTTTSLAEHEHIGLRNVHERVRNKFGEAYGLYILPLSERDGFGVRLSIPLQRKESDQHV